MKSTVAPASFGITLFKVTLSASVPDCLHDQEFCGCTYHSSFYLFFTNIMAHVFSTTRKFKAFYILDFKVQLNNESFYKCYTLLPILQCTNTISIISK